MSAVTWPGDVEHLGEGLPTVDSARGMVETEADTFARLAEQD